MTGIQWRTHSCVVIVGGGFGGLPAAKAATPRRRHPHRSHESPPLQPLLYQVAIPPSAGQIGWPIRNILRRQKNTTVSAK
jgi:NADH dehydrogenase FAD-containing subunit